MGLVAAIELLACPLCFEPLTLADSVRCSNGHSFDVARQGYVNLSGRSAPHNADTAAMVAARVAFLAAGHYAPIAAALAASVPDGATTVLDAGAGTGYYAARLLDVHAGVRGVALDISVPAIRRAARAHDRLGAVVGNVWGRLAIRDGVMDAVVSVFAPRNPAEFARILAGPGRLVTVTPTSAHLAALRTDLDLLGHQPDKSDRLASSLGTHFRTDRTVVVTEQQSWHVDAARQAVLMGPNAFHLTPTELDGRLARLRWPRPITISARVDTWRFLS